VRAVMARLRDSIDDCLDVLVRSEADCKTDEVYDLLVALQCTVSQLGRAEDSVTAVVNGRTAA
jgi:hypothetical protein